MKLAIVTETFPPEVNGVATTFGIIASELARRQHKVTVYRPERTDLNATPGSYHEVAVLGMAIPGYPLLRLGLPAGGLLRKRWKIDRPDLVHVVTEGPLGASAVGAARSLGIPVTSSFHTNFHSYTKHYRMPSLRRAILWWLRKVHNDTLCTFAPTNELCDELSGLGFRNMVLLSRGVDTDQFNPAHRSAELRKQWGATPDTPVVLHAGRMAAEKNYPLLMQIFERMQQANPSCRFVLAGDGPLRAKLQKDYPNYIYHGLLQRDELARHYASADIYIHPSLSETFGNVLTEAMASRLAVAGFDYAAARKFVRDENNGLVVPCDQPEALIEASVRLATDAKLRERVRANARTTIEPQSWSSVIGRFEADLLAVVNASRGATSEFVLQIP